MFRVRRRVGGCLALALLLTMTPHGNGVHAEAGGRSDAAPQALVHTGDRNWTTWVDRFVSLTVMIDALPTDGCRGSGIIVSVDDKGANVMTAWHVLRKLSPSGVPPATFGIRTNLPSGPRPDDERVTTRWPARMTHHDTTLDLAVIRVDDPGIAPAVTRWQHGPVFGAIADGLDLVADDQVYAIGCGAERKAQWDYPLDTVGLLSRPAPTDAKLHFPASYIRPGYSGGPLLHVVGMYAAIVGMTQGGAALTPGAKEGEALEIRRALRQLRAWNVPVMLAPVGSDPDCAYDVSPTRVTVDPVPGRPVTVTLKSSKPNCRWAAEYDRLAWIGVEQAEPNSHHRGRTRADGTAQLKIFINHGQNPQQPLFDPCVSPHTHTTVRIAGRIVEVTPACPGRAVRR